MTQLIINGTAYPETSSDKYQCYDEDLSKDLRMASGRLVREIRGRIRIIKYQYDYMGDELLRTLLSDLRQPEALTVSYLTPENDTLETSRFRCTDYPKPAVAFSDGGHPKWHDVSFTLEEVSPRA